ncbi:Ig-like domain-containing protein, partial [Rathayibacter sp. ZW T2_19]
TPAPTATPTATSAPVGSSAPTVAIVAPTSGSSVTGVVTLVAVASDDKGVAGVSYWVGTTKLGDAVLGEDGRYSLAVNTSAFAVGTYAVTAKAVDTDGNTTTSAPIALKRV